jgi:predicted RNA-binding Zn ribbon-like protein
MRTVEFRTGYGAAWLDLLATRIGRYGGSAPAELVDDAAALRRWLSEHDLAPAGPIHDADVTAAQELREAMHALAAAAVARRRPHRSNVHVVETALAADRPPSLRVGAVGLRAQRPADVSEALARLARQSIDDLTGPARGRLRACGDETCAGIFLDDTGRRRWCADERCGVRARVRAHPARQKA